MKGCFMKNKSLLILLASTALMLGACGGSNKDDSSTKDSSSTASSGETSSEQTSSQAESSGQASSQEEQSSEQASSQEEQSSEQESSEEQSSGEQGEIVHQDPLVKTITDPSTLRTYDERFDEMADDFVGETINGETTGTLNQNVLRALVDSQDLGEPTTPDGAIYKMGTGTYDIDKYDGIGFTIRITGSKSLNLSNLVLGLRGGDGYQVYPINLAEAVDMDGDALPELTDEFQEIIVSPQLSIEDANTVYLNKDGSPSELKVLDEILGFHLYALDEECSAIVEIKEVYLTKAGEKTVVDAFDREDVKKTDDTVYWRDSTGFIVRKGVTLKDGQSYTAPYPTGTFENLVLVIAGDTTGTDIRVGDGLVTWANLKDSGENAVSEAVNGGFYGLVVNAAQSGLDPLENGFSVHSTTEVTIAQVFYTNLEVPAPVVDYPTFDALTAFTFDNFNREQSGFNGDYEAAITDPQTLEAGLSYQLSYNHGDMVTVDGSALVFDATDLADEDYINYKACNDHLEGDHDYMILALKAEEGATLDNFRLNIGSGVTYINEMYSGEGLPVATLDQADYPYIRGGYTWLIVDLEASGMSRGNEPFIDYYYSGTGKLSIDFVAFANAEEDEYELTPYVTKAYDEGAGYDYAGYVYSPATSDVIVLDVTASNTIDSIRFENADTFVQYWFHDKGIVDIDGNVIPETAGTGTYYIDLIASGMKEEGQAVGFHVHGDGTNGSLDFSVGSLDLVVKTQEILFVDKTYEEGAGYDYAGYLWSPANTQIMKIEYESSKDISSLRFENADTKEQFWVKNGQIKDGNGNTLDANNNEGTFYVDLVASGVKEAGSAVGIHFHGDGENGALSFKAYSVEPLPEFEDILTVEPHDIEDISGYKYAGGMDNFGAQYLILHLSSNDEGVDLRSLRVESGDVTAWVKDGALIGADGEPFARDTVVTAEGITLVVDLAASNLIGNAIHLHIGGFEESAGSLNISATLQYATNSVGHILATLGW